MVARIVRFMLKHRFFSCAGIVAVTVISAIPFLKYSGRADNSLPVWYSPSDPAYAAYQNYLQKFGDDRFMVIAVETSGVFSWEVLGWLEMISNRLSQVEGVSRVISLTSVPMATGVGDEVRLAPLYAGYPKNEKGLAAFQDEVESADEIKGLLVSSDKRVAGLILRIETPATSEASAKLVHEVQSVLAGHNPHHYAWHTTGAPVGDAAFNTRVNRDYRLFFPAVLLLNLILLFLFFKDWRIAVLPSLLQALALVWVLGLHFALGFSTNVVTAMLGPILVTVCIANAVHLIMEYREGLAGGLNREASLVQAVQRLWRPSLFTALTTMAGFLSFGTSSIPPVALLGYLTAFGVMVALGLNLFFLPVVLTVLPVSLQESKVQDLHHPRLESLVNRLAKWGTRHTLLVSRVALALVLVSLSGVLRLQTESNFFDYFFKGEKVRQDMEFIEEKLAGMGSFNIEIESDDPHRPAALDRRAHEALETVSARLLADERTRDHTRQVRRSWPWLKALHRAFGNTEESPSATPELSELWALADSSPEIARLSTPDKKSLAATVRTRWLPSSEMEKYLQDVKTILKEYLPSGLHATVTGYGPLWVALDRAIFRSQLASLLMALGVVTLLMTLFSGGIRLGLIGLIPNVLPILLTFGLMGFAGIHLNVATVMIAGVSLGITVDDTIHYLSRFRLNLGLCGGDYHRALEMTSRGMGSAIALSALIMAGGFSVLCLGSFLPTIYFGSLVSLTLLLGIFCELVITPMLVMKLRPFTK